jgi:hypothetical protein
VKVTAEFLRILFMVLSVFNAFLASLFVAHAVLVRLGILRIWIRELPRPLGVIYLPVLVCCVLFSIVGLVLSRWVSSSIAVRANILATGVLTCLLLWPLVTATVRALFF